jgi:glycosyltransferase involved in cell wall biosynthesis
MNTLRNHRKPLTLGIGHFWIGQRDGVNVVIMRNVESLLKLHPEIKITLFGKLSGAWSEFAKSIPSEINYINIDEFDPDYAAPGLTRKSISEQKIQDYIWQGTNIMETLVKKLRPLDVVIAENLGIGIHPSVTYAFYLYIKYCQRHHPNKRIFYRAHDFLQQRAKNFENLKKFHDTEIPLIPNWHEVIYPNYPNVGYITINKSDISRLIEHGVDRERIAYVPNCIEEGLLVDDDEHKNLRRRMIERTGVKPDVRFILYPVRCVPRKNVEEAVFLTCLLNEISRHRLELQGTRLSGHFHLLVGIKPDSGEDLVYAERIKNFCRDNCLPVSVGIQDLVSFEREAGGAGAGYARYSIGDAYNMSDIVVTTSYLEGFGFAFIEPWYLGKAVIGRNISNVTQDFNRAGVNLDHLYNVLRINGQDFLSMGYQDKVQVGLDKRLREILKLNELSYVRKIIEANEQSVSAMMNFLDSARASAIISRNREVVASTYSPARVAEQLLEVLTTLPLRPSR